MRILSILILIASIGVCNAQMVSVKEKNSFYVGKRSAVSAGINLQGTLHATIASEESKYNLIGMVISPKVEYTYGLTNGLSIQVLGEIHKTTRNTRTDNYYRFFEVPDNIPFSNNYFEYDKEFGMPQYFGTSLGLKLNWHLKNRAALAPIGPHIGLGLKHGTIRANYDFLRYTGFHSYGNPKSPDLSLVGETSKHKMINLNFDYVGREMVAENMFIDFGVSFALPPLIYSSSYSNENNSLQEDMLESIRARYVLHDLVQLKLVQG